MFQIFPLIFKRPILQDDRQRLVMIILNMLVLFTGIFLFLTLVSDLMNPVPWWAFGSAFLFSWVLKFSLHQTENFSWISHGIVLVIFGTLQFVVFSEPATLQTILYWNVAPPLIGSLILNRKGTLAWAFITFLFSVVALFYALNYGPEVVYVKKGDNIIEALIFYVVLCLCVFFFLKIQWNAKKNLRDKNVELVELHNEVQAQNEELQQQRDQLSLQTEFITQKNDRLQGFLDILLKLGNSRNIHFGELDKAKLEICQTASNFLKVSRVSLWKYLPEEGALECELMFENGSLLQHKTRLYQSDYPIYFKEIQSKGLLIVADMQSDPRTVEFKKGYADVFGIKSMMDSPYFIDGTLGGIICCEHQLYHKVWNLEDTLILKTLSEYLTLSEKTSQFAINNQLLEQRNQEIDQMNNHLEETIKARMAELEKKNLQLSEYAFMNSHILRGPIARMAGLYYLVENQHPELKKDMIFKYLKGSIDELDEVSKNINKAIENNSSKPS